MTLNYLKFLKLNYFFKILYKILASDHPLGQVEVGAGVGVPATAASTTPVANHRY